MELRLNWSRANPAAYEMMLAFEKHAQNSGIDPILYELIKIRASQINGCAFCIDMHSKDLQKMGESMERILLLTVWREVPIYTDKEKAVLELTEHVTRISKAGVPQPLYDKVRTHFDEQQFVEL